MFSRIECKKQMTKEIVLHRDKGDNCWLPVEKIHIPATGVNVMNHRFK